MMATRGAAVSLLALVLAACGGSGEGSGPASGEVSASPRCYELVEGASRAVVKVAATPTTDNPEGGEITIYSYVDGVEEFTPETTSGRLEADAFVYADGTRLALTDANLTWPQGSLLEGAVFTSTTCP